MSRLPPLELLEETHRFPGQYTFKVIGRAGDDFPERVSRAVEGALSRPQTASRSRFSEHRRHVSVTVEINVRSAQEIHDVYLALLKLPGVLLVL